MKTLRRSVLPLAVRETLNDLAFDVKGRTLTESAAKSFAHSRVPTVWKKFSGVNRATGWNINSMKSEVGMTAGAVAKAKPLVANMEAQEEGGKIDEGLDYLRASRTSGSNDNTVRGKRRWSNLPKLTNGNPNTYTWKGRKQLTGGTTKSRMINALFMSAYTQRVMRIKQGGRNLYILVESIKKYTSSKFTSQFKITSKLLYVSRGDNQKPVSATHFSKNAAMMTVQRTQEFWIKNAQKQIDRVMNA